MNSVRLAVIPGCPDEEKDADVSEYEPCSIIDDDGVPGHFEVLRESRESSSSSG